MPEQLPQAIEAVIIEARQFLVDEIDSRRASIHESDVDANLRDNFIGSERGIQTRWILSKDATGGIRRGSCELS